jgi:hypothetical protein
MGGCASSIEPVSCENPMEKNMFGPGSLYKMEPATLASITDTDLTLGSKISDEELEKAVDKIFERFD